MSSDLVCPYCGGVLKKEPKANTKCHQCGKTIFVRKKQPFFNKNLLTEEEMLISDEFVMLTSLYGFGVTRDTYEQTRVMLSKRFGTEAGWGDVAWSIYAELADKFARIPDFEKLATIYACMAAHLHNRHKPYRQCALEYHRYRIMLFREHGFRKVRVAANPYGCEACELLRDKVYPISEELVKSPPLPPENCTCQLIKSRDAGYCICQLVAEDLDQKAMMRHLGLRS